ncbi:hypothetical protein BH23GEM4_BH23GEM4_02950 [soil metagenome]
MNVDHVGPITRAVLYEGYLLWPYRRSALKNRQRWTFGGVFPEGWSRAGHPDDLSTVQTQCLLEADPRAVVDVTVRFLQVVERKVAERNGDTLDFVDDLTVEGERFLAWDEAREREVNVSASLGELLASPRRVPIEFPTGGDEETTTDHAGTPRGALVRSWNTLAGSVEVRAEALEEGVARLTVQVANTTPWFGNDREGAQRSAFASTHTVLHVIGGEWGSATDPPERLRALSEACENRGSWPVLVGEKGDRSTLLSSPIILEDYPRIAPESPGDLFDGGEIDQLLILNILSLTDEEKAEMRATDPRAREILDRCSSLSSEELMRLHGTIRELRPLHPE